MKDVIRPMKNVDMGHVPQHQKIGDKDTLFVAQSTFLVSYPFESIAWDGPYPVIR